ncbi:fimbrial protein [Morganella morganii]|uniref:fimbrial protein n=1 Tax=Morganella morganii TaxID=582 RepID=UPI001BDAF0FE|nr:fimbrial protein [Morganella morganii]ELT0455011.1 type 1 fimbrial protein [Morganella morganii]MBT0338202.1 type 1 fimbrial protein [Morganella morganii subsp. morganii]
MKKSLIGKSLISVLLAGSAMSASAVEQTGKISFKGFIYNATCSIVLNDTNSPNADVLMGRYPTSAFTKSGDEVGGEDGNGSLSISLLDCPEKGKVTLQLHGQPKDGYDAILELDNPKAQNTAKNVGIVLYDRDDMNTDIIINGSVTKEYEVSSSTEWHADYVAKYISTADDVEAGQADATLNYTLSYN